METNWADYLNWDDGYNFPGSNDFNMYSKSRKMEKSMMVSDLFIDIYINFNVSSQDEKMKKLSKSEIYLLIALCSDRHDDNDSICIDNFKNYISELNEILDLCEDKETSNIHLINLIKNTDDKYIDTDILVDKNGNKIPDPLSKNEVRDLKINNILN